jgi:hypothetical protein
VDNALWLVVVFVLLLYGLDAQRRQGIPVCVGPANRWDVLFLSGRVIAFLIGLWSARLAFSSSYHQTIEGFNPDVLTHLRIVIGPGIFAVICIGAAVSGVRLLYDKWRASFSHTLLPWCLAILLGFSVYMHYPILGWHARFCHIVQGYVAVERHRLTGKDLGAPLRLLKEESPEGVRYRLLMQLEKACEKFYGQSSEYIFTD